MELEINYERITDSVSKRRAAGRDLGMSRATMHRRMAELDARGWIRLQAD